MRTLESAIPVGKENAIHLETFASLLGVSCTTVKKKVRDARNEGAEIVSGRDGYWIAENDQELKTFVSVLSKQAFTRLKTVKPIKNTLDTVKGQITLSEVFEEVTDNEKT